TRRALERGTAGAPPPGEVAGRDSGALPDAPTPAQSGGEDPLPPTSGAGGTGHRGAERTTRHASGAFARAEQSGRRNRLGLHRLQSHPHVAPERLGIAGNGTAAPAGEPPNQNLAKISSC